MAEVPIDTGAEWWGNTLVAPDVRMTASDL